MVSDRTGALERRMQAVAAGFRALTRALPDKNEVTYEEVYRAKARLGASLVVYGLDWAFGNKVLRRKENPGYDQATNTFDLGRCAEHVAACAARMDPSNVAPFSVEAGVVAILEIGLGDLIVEVNPTVEWRHIKAGLAVAARRSADGDLEVAQAEKEHGRVFEGAVLTALASAGGRSPVDYARSHFDHVLGKVNPGWDGSGDPQRSPVYSDLSGHGVLGLLFILGRLEDSGALRDLETPLPFRD